MLNGHILITHLLSLILRGHKHLVERLAYHKLNVTRYLGLLLKRFLGTLYKRRKMYFHLLHELCNKTILYGKKGVQKMFLVYFLITVFIGKLLTVVESFR